MSLRKGCGYEISHGVAKPIESIVPKEKIGVISVFKIDDIIDETRANNLSPVVLAFVGDAVYSLFVRERLVFNSDYKTGELNKLATKEVNAIAQSEFVKEIMPLLNEKELLVYKRGRNAKKPTKSKSASVAEYNASTGFEALLGYLYVTGNHDRINFLLNKGKNNES